MKAVAITAKGAEDAVILDLKEQLKADGNKLDGAVMFDAPYESVCNFAYRSQSVSRVLRLLCTASVNNHLEESVAAIRHGLEEADLSVFEGKSFRVNCKRHGNQDYSSQDMSAMIGDILVHKSGAKVNLTEPDLVVHVEIIGTEGYVGIDLSGFDLGKRDYKVFSHPSSLSGITAYSLLRLSGYIPKMDLLDPFSGAGTIPIEAALYSTGLSPHHFKADRFMFKAVQEKKTQPKGTIKGFDHLLRNVIAAKKNASIAGVEKDISLSKVEVEWLDTKVDKSSIDIIATHPPSPSKITDDKELAKTYRELFYQADYVLRKEGSLAILLQNSSLLLETLAKSDKFILDAEHTLWQGNMELKVLLIKRR